MIIFFKSKTYTLHELEDGFSCHITYQVMTVVMLKFQILMKIIKILYITNN